MDRDGSKLRGLGVVCYDTSVAAAAAAVTEAIEKMSRTVMNSVRKTEQQK